MPSVPNTSAPPGIEPGPFGTLPGDATTWLFNPRSECIFKISRSSSYVKVIGSSSRSQEQKKQDIDECNKIRIAKKMKFLTKGRKEGGKTMRHDGTAACFRTSIPLEFIVRLQQ